MEIQKLSLAEKTKIQELITKNLPLYNELDKSISEMEEFYLQEFTEIQEVLQNLLINDENILDKELAKVYASELAIAKAEIIERAKESFSNIEQQFLATTATTKV